jgi:hypothetical protein
VLQKLDVPCFVFVSLSHFSFFRIDEHATLLSLLEKHLCPGPWKDQLTQYRSTELRDLKLFIQKSAKVLLIKLACPD